MLRPGAMSGSNDLPPGGFNPEDLDPALDIDVETQKNILTFFANLDRLSHYELLGVEPTADKKDIKSAYFARMNQFHVDKFYGKNIGAFGQKLQKIAQQLTRANDVLTKKKPRAEYDEYLASRNQTLGARDSIPPERRSSIPPSGARSRPSRPAVAPIDFVTIPSSPRAPVPSAVTSPVSPPPLSPSSGSALGEAPPGSEQAPVVPAQAPPIPAPASKGGNEAARRLLARKMGLSPRAARSSGPVSSASRPAIDSHQARQALDADLKARFDARKNQGQQLAAKCRAEAQEARAQGDWGRAVSAIRKALQATPEDSQLQAEVGAMQAEADRALAPRFIEQGRYEEREGSFDRAARSYERAARGKNSAELFDRAARCLLKQGRLNDEEKRKLVDLARKSVSLDNRQVDYRLTLAKAYDVTGMKTSALGELRRALELDPNNKDAKELQKAFR